MAIPIQVVFDCADPPVVARFWAGALGYQLQGPPEPSAAWLAFQDEHGIPEERRNDASAIIDPDGTATRIYFQRVPEPKASRTASISTSTLAARPALRQPSGAHASMRRSNGWSHPVPPSCARARSTASTA